MRGSRTAVVVVQLAAIAAVAVAFAYGVRGQLTVITDSHRRAEHAAIVQSSVDRLSAREWAAMAGAPIDAAELGSVVEDALTGAPAGMGPLLADVAAFKAAIESQLDALAAGQRDRAERIDTETVDPLYERISDEVTELRDDADRDAVAARGAVRRGVSMLCVGAVGVVGGLLVHASRLARRRVQAETAEAASRRFRSLVEHAPDVLLVIDNDDRVRYHAPAAARLLGHSPDRLDGAHLADFLDPDDVGSVRVALNRARSAGQATTAVRFTARTATGAGRVLDAVLTDATADRGVGGVVVNARDVTDSVALQAELSHLAFHDRLTGLANRALFNNRLAHALSRTGTPATSLAVLAINIDDFKSVNDTLGHGRGDQLLVDFANRVGSCLRVSDTAARLGGDEFGVIVDNLADSADAEQLAARVLEAVSLPFEVDGMLCSVTTSIGIATELPQIGGPGGTTCGARAAERLLVDADVALYHAKRAGKNRFVVFDPATHGDTLARNALRADLSEALRLGAIDVHYQPIVELQSGRLLGVEALARWTHPTRGPIGPAEFVPLAEEGGLVVQLGEQVLARALRDLSTVLDQTGVAALGVAVNLSALQLRSRDVVDRLLTTIADSAYPATSLTLELTESVLVDDPEALSALDRLRQHGCRIAIDDFGTGFSSLAYLERLPVDILKIDRAFTQRLGNGAARSSLAATIIGLARSHGLATVAEGVETVAQVEELRELGCDRAQGYLLSRPLPCPALVDFVRQHCDSSAFAS